MTLSQPVLGVIVFLALAGLFFMTISLIYDWFRDDSKNDESHKPPWNLGDAVRFGFGFGMGMFLWGVFTVLVSALVIWIFLTGGAGLAGFFSPSNTQVNGSSGQYGL